MHILGELYDHMERDRSSTTYTFCTKSVSLAAVGIIGIQIP